MDEARQKYFVEPPKKPEPAKPKEETKEEDKADDKADKGTPAEATTEEPKEGGATAVSILV